MIELTDSQKAIVINSQSFLLTFLLIKDEKLEEIAALIETIEDYVEKEGITN